jgi:hypothetical protein
MNFQMGRPLPEYSRSPIAPYFWNLFGRVSLIYRLYL